MELPTIPILLMTYYTDGREGYVFRTMSAFYEHIRYDGMMMWIITVDNGTPEFLERLRRGRVNHNFTLPSHPRTVMEIEGQCGYRWNEGVAECYKIAPLYFRLEDDMVLQHDLDITPYVRLLMEREDVGMIRLGLMPIHLDLHSVGYDGRIYMDVLKSQPYTYSGNPGLIHKRFHDAYGLYDENCNPGDTEVRLDHIVRNKEGPRIWMPWDLGKFGTPGPFAHIGQVQSYKE